MVLNRFDRFLCNIAEIDLYWHRLASAEMEGYGLRGTSAVYFTKLIAHPEGLTAAQLAAMCGRDKADVSRDVTVMERQGVVCRVQTAGKAYRAQIRLTAHGKDIADQVSRKVAYAVEQVGGSLTDADREVLYRALDTISTNLQALSERGMPDLLTEEE